MGVRLYTDPSFIMACIAFETEHTFSPSIRNAAGSGAVGLIQFMPATARNLGTTAESLAKMSAEAQLAYVQAYLRPYVGRLADLADVYMAILWPAAVGKPLEFPLFRRSDTKHPAFYRQNAGLDINRDAVVTKEEASAYVRRELIEGLKPENASQ
jgi:soluble lytic murein transglycosylase-like protein